MRCDFALHQALHALPFPPPLAVGAVLDGKTDLAIGNVVGSNIFNVLFILGVSALITPLLVNVQLIRQEVPIMIGASVVLAVMVVDDNLGRWESLLLLVLPLPWRLRLLALPHLPLQPQGPGIPRP